MRQGRSVILVAAACVVGVGIGARIGAGQEPGIVLLDAPRGGWLGEIRAGAPLEVIEERDGWRKVRIEGWVRALPGGAPAMPSSTAPPVPAVPPAAAGASRAQGISGLLSPRPQMQPATTGGGLVVLVLADPDATDAAHQALGERCRADLAAFDGRLQGLAAEVQAALNSSANFKEAAQRSDRAKAALAAEQRARAARLQQCREQAESFFSERAIARTVSDAAGRFEATSIAPGRYRVVAMERGAAGARAWSMLAEVTAGAGAVLEGRAADGPDPYWGLKDPDPGKAK
jgi:hypothetical protein